MDKILQTLGLAFKGKRIVIGEDAFTNIKKVCLLIAATDASQNTKKRCQDKANFYHLEYLEAFNKEQIGTSLGKSYVSVIGILDEGLKTKILKSIESR